MQNDSILIELKNKIGVGKFNLPIFIDKPIYLGENTKSILKKQKVLIRKFLSIVSNIAKNSLKDNSKNEIRKILFSESVLGMDTAYYKSLDDFCWNIPVMFRTDQSIDGKIFEIQSPGSGWGDIPLIYTSLSEKYPEFIEKTRKYVEEYTNFIKKITSSDNPIVAHFEDASSNPTSIKYLKAITSNDIKYWGLDGDVNMEDVDYVVTHSVNSLIGLNCFEKYKSQAKQKKLIFCIQPNFLFDQKAIYLLPFLKETSSLFNEAIRQLFPYTSYLHNGGFCLKDGRFITIEKFSKLISSERRYYLKYAGPNVSKNWGSKSVFRLSKNDCYELLKRANELAEKGEIWIVQEDITSFSDMEKSEYSDDINQILKNHNHLKISAFHTPYSIIGYKVMFRKHFKVHGQKDTYIGVGI